MFFRAVIVACGLSLATSAVSAQTFDCNISDPGRGGWVTERYVFQVDRANGKATALDGLINHMFKKPIAATISDANDKTTRLKWQVKGVPSVNRATGSSSGNINLSYTAVLNSKTNEVNVRGTVTSGGGAGSSGSSGRGTCKVSGYRSSNVVEPSTNKRTALWQTQDGKCVSGSDTDRTIVACPPDKEVSRGSITAGPDKTQCNDYAGSPYFNPRCF